jgi:hypothetical protein
MALGGNSGSGVYVGRGVEVGRSVAVGCSVAVGGIGVFVGKEVDVGVTGVESGAQPLTRTVRNTTARKINSIDFFISSSPFDYSSYAVSSFQAQGRPAQREQITRRS